MIKKYSKMKYALLVSSFALAIFFACSGFVVSSTTNQIQENYNDADSSKSMSGKFVSPRSNAILYIGGPNVSKGGKLTKANFLNYIQAPFCAVDSANRTLQVESFDFTYCEKQLSEDSTGREIIVTECIGDNISSASLSKKWIDNFNERAFKGDSIVFDNFYLRDGKKLLRHSGKMSVVIVP
jgi:hypothetical protein